MVELLAQASALQPMVTQSLPAPPIAKTKIQHSRQNSSSPASRQVSVPTHLAPRLTSEHLPSVPSMAVLTDQGRAVEPLTLRVKTKSIMQTTDSRTPPGEAIMTTTRQYHPFYSFKTDSQAMQDVQMVDPHPQEQIIPVQPPPAPVILPYSQSSFAEKEHTLPRHLVPRFSSVSEQSVPTAVPAPIATGQQVSHSYIMSVTG